MGGEETGHLRTRIEPCQVWHGSQVWCPERHFEQRQHLGAERGLPR